MNGEVELIKTNKKLFLEHRNFTELLAFFLQFIDVKKVICSFPRVNKMF